VEQEIQYRQWSYLFGHIVSIIAASCVQNYYFSSEIVVSFQKSFVLFAISSAVVDVENA
jgi:hypothetical protein